MARISGDPVRGAYRGAADVVGERRDTGLRPARPAPAGPAGGTAPGSQALDAGAGTGAAGDVLRELGAHGGVGRPGAGHAPARLAGAGQAVVADVARLPVRSGQFDVVVAAFVLNHVADHMAALRELSSVTRPGGVLLASVFANERSALKEVVDDRLQAFGWSPPEWYAAVRERAEARSARSTASRPEPAQPGWPPLSDPRRSTSDWRPRNWSCGTDCPWLTAVTSLPGCPMT